jgi:hypothetical protein
VAIRLALSPPGGTRLKPVTRMTLITVSAVLMVCTAGSTRAVFASVTRKVASSVGTTCLRTLKTASERRKSCGE